MDIHDVYTPEELEALSDDARMAFSEIARKASTVLHERTKSIADNDEEGWRYLVEERYGYVNLMIAVGKSLKIDHFTERELPEAKDFDNNDYREFRGELDHYLTQIALDNARRGKREGIVIPQDAKDRIRKHINALKGLIDKAEIDEKKKTSMRRKLEQFENELDKRRLPLGAVGLIALSLFALPPDMADNAQMAIQLISGIFAEVNDARTLEEEQRQLPPITEPALITPPRKPPTGFSGPQRRPSAPAFESGAMDDDIPF